ncbi:MAG: radical SAM protein [Candidatus Omnitrophica bacterium]|nr:radical SAM protein [Candidatus Omnitrophota bacterium]
MKIVVANSVGVDKRGYKMIHYPSRWTTGVKRMYFAWYPWELAYLTALLKRETGHDVKMIDGCLREFDCQTYLKEIIKERPDFLIMESSTRTIDEDLRLALQLKKQLGTKLIFAGQHASAYPEELSKSVDFVCQGEYEFTVLDIIQGKEVSSIEGIYPNACRDPLDVNSLPWPEDDDIKRIDYCVPGPPGLRFRQIQAYGSRGCPFRCSFCVCSNLYYSKPTWRARNTDDIVKEISYLKNKYKEMEGIFFDEEIHNFKRDHVIELCKKIIASDLNKLHYTAMCAYATLDEEVLEIMKKAGYYQIRIGIETASDKIAESIGMRGKIDIKRLFRVLEKAKKLGFEIYGTFLIGAPGADIQEDEKTLCLLRDLLKKELICELQVSICTPQPGTPFFNDMQSQGLLRTKDWQRYDGTTEAVVSYPQYGSKDIERQFKRAVDIGHYYRGKMSLKRDGLWVTLNKALQKRGFFGLLGVLIKRLLGKV